MLTKLRDFWNISNQTHSVRGGCGSGVRGRRRWRRLRRGRHRALRLPSTHLTPFAPPPGPACLADHHSGDAQRPRRGGGAQRRHALAATQEQDGAGAGALTRVSGCRRAHGCRCHAAHILPSLPPLRPTRARGRPGRGGGGSGPAGTPTRPCTALRRRAQLLVCSARAPPSCRPPAHQRLHPYQPPAHQPPAQQQGWEDEGALLMPPPARRQAAGAAALPPYSAGPAYSAGHSDSVEVSGSSSLDSQLTRRRRAKTKGGSKGGSKKGGGGGAKRNKGGGSGTPLSKSTRSCVPACELPLC